jgi:hypothetical protein
MKDSKRMLKSLGLVGIALCAACCALPIIGVMVGVGSLSVLSRYFEWAGIAALVLALAFFGIYYFRKKSTPACDIDCECKTDDKFVGAANSKKV